MKERPNYVDRLSMEEAYMKARVERIEAVKPSLTAFYNTLSPEQKAVARPPASDGRHDGAAIAAGRGNRLGARRPSRLARLPRPAASIKACGQRPAHGRRWEVRACKDYSTSSKSWARSPSRKRGPAPARAARSFGVVEAALVERQAAAADAAVEQVARLLQHVDPRLQGAADARADRLPVLRVGRAPCGSRSTVSASISLERQARAAGRSGQMTGAGCPRA